MRAAQAIEAYWTQTILGEANGSLFKVARGKGAVNWHSHRDEDEAFFVLEGSLTIHLRDRDIYLETGDFFIVPKGVEHRPAVGGEEDALLLVVGKSVTSTLEGGKPLWSFES